MTSQLPPSLRGPTGAEAIFPRRTLSVIARSAATKQPPCVTPSPSLRGPTGAEAISSLRSHSTSPFLRSMGSTWGARPLNLANATPGSKLLPLP